MINRMSSLLNAVVFAATTAIMIIIIEIIEIVGSIG